MKRTRTISASYGIAAGALGFGIGLAVIKHLGRKFERALADAASMRGAVEGGFMSVPEPRYE